MAFVESILEQYWVNEYVNYASTKGIYASSVSKYQIFEGIQSIMTHLNTIYWKLWFETAGFSYPTKPTFEGVPLI